MFQVRKMQFKLTPYPWIVLGVTSQTLVTYLAHIKDLNFFGVGGGLGWGKNLVKPVFMSVYCKLAANSIQKHVKRGREESQNVFAYWCRLRASQ